VINNFDTGIDAIAPNVSIRGNYIGTNGLGTAAVPNDVGIRLDGTDLVSIGGTTGVSPTGPCQGYCNLISGNSVAGVKIGGLGAGGVSRQTVIEGNFIGTNAQGTSAVGNQDGIYFENGDARIGGPMVKAGNVVSGNANYGVHIPSYSNAAGTLIQGNLIGTNAAANGAVPNFIGLYVDGLDTLTIGAPGAPPNVISGNSSDGVFLDALQHVVAQNNLMGVGLDGSMAIGNGGRGINLLYTTNSIFGGNNTGEGNTIAFSGGDGIYVGLGSFSDSIRGNSIFSNAGKGILNSDNGISGKGNSGIQPPVIVGIQDGQLYGGGACFACAVDVYSDGGDEGRIYEGFTIAYGFPDGWAFTALYGPNVTVTVTDADNNTSEFSAPFALPATPTPTPTPSPTPTASPTPSPTPTSTHSPSPTPTPDGTLVQGDADCDGDADLDDVIVLLGGIAGGGFGAPCNAVTALGATTDTRDVNCDEHVTPLDPLDILLHLAELPELPKSGNCPDVGDPI
jgi:hypothetical protein